MTEAQVDDIKYNYVLPISRLNKKRWPLYTEYENLNQQLLTWNATYDECKIARDAIDKSIRTNYAIYEKNSDGQIVLKETNISAYPPGANIGTTGWVEAAIVYSESDAPEDFARSAMRLLRALISSSRDVIFPIAAFLSSVRTVISSSWALESE